MALGKCVIDVEVEWREKREYQMRKDSLSDIRVLFFK